VHQVLQGDDSDQVLFVDDQNNAQIARCQFAEADASDSCLPATS